VPPSVVSGLLVEDSEEAALQEANCRAKSWQTYVFTTKKGAPVPGKDHCGNDHCGEENQKGRAD
jgi:hypothetical protein